MHRKVADAESLAQHLRPGRQAGRTVVQCHGCFDIVHPGHIRYLQFARQLGDVLVVSLTGDAMLSKGPDRPYLPQELRAESLAALELVDWVVIDPHPTACELLETLRPDVYVKGREYAASDDPRFVREREIVEQYGGRVVFHSGDVVFSSTRLIESLDGEQHLDEVRLRAFCARNEIDPCAVRKTLESFRDVSAIVVGDVVCEKYILCDPRDAVGDAPALALQKLGEQTYWGGAAAIAMQLQALGARPTLVASVGDDDVSRRLRDDMARLGIECALYGQRADLVEHCTFVADDAKLFKLTQGATCPLDSAWEQRMVAELRPRIADAALLIWCELGFGAVTPGLVRALTPAARACGCCVTGAAPGPSADARMLLDMDLLAITERKVRSAMHDLGSGLPSVVWRLLERSHGRTALVSLHKRGLIGFDGRGEPPAGDDHGSDAPSAPPRLKSEFVPTQTRHFVDLLGAEEAALAVASLTLASGGSLPIATYLACAAEARVSRCAGRTRVTLDELLTWIESRPELRLESRFMPDAATIGDIARIAPPLSPMNPPAESGAGVSDVEESGPRLRTAAEEKT